MNSPSWAIFRRTVTTRDAIGVVVVVVVNEATFHSLRLNYNNNSNDDNNKKSKNSVCWGLELPPGTKTTGDSPCYNVVARQCPSPFPIAAEAAATAAGGVFQATGSNKGGGNPTTATATEGAIVDVMDSSDDTSIRTMGG